MQLSGQLHAPAVLAPRKNPGTHGTRGWVRPRAGTDGFVENARAPTGIRTRTVQAVADRIPITLSRLLSPSEYPTINDFMVVTQKSI